VKNLQWGNGRVTPKTAPTGNKVAHNAVALHQLLQHERSLASAAAREAHLRTLLGLPAQRPAGNDEGGK
jgi:hypothetical protein